MLRFLQKLLARGESDGNRGERLAATWLKQKRGFSIVAQNWRNPRDRREEIDLVAREGEVLVFVEVKARAAGALVPGYHAVDRRKKRVLRRAIRSYLAGLKSKPRTFRFDVVEVSFSSGELGRSGAAGEPEILHFENVELFPKHFRG